MSSDTRLLLPFLKYLKTEPVIVDYQIFSEACATIFCFVSFLLTNVCVLKCIFFNVYRENVVVKTFFEKMERILLEDVEDEMADEESTGCDEIGGEAEAETQQI
ncbi:hypothetical protein Bhyg_10497 [Pseudolycoriella hygida]|uniref:Uncharacterized protein n=1 Tax=Pseudolycoriella hygida TaxID=35572 RepID=A0A9Q0MTK5_9DIPT|nr:hypothetical protein Bhyg_10497 [Pseudolycoriella hygida]